MTLVKSPVASYENEFKRTEKEPKRTDEKGGHIHKSSLVPALPRAPHNQKCHEQTQHLIENKDSHFAEPSIWLKMGTLNVITQHVIDRQSLTARNGGEPVNQ